MVCAQLNNFEVHTFTAALVCFCLVDLVHMCKSQQSLDECYNNVIKTFMYLLSYLV